MEGKKGSQLPKVTWPVGSRAGLGIQALRPQSLTLTILPPGVHAEGQKKEPAEYSMQDRAGMEKGLQTTQCGRRVKYKVRTVRDKMKRLV